MSSTNHPASTRPADDASTPSVSPNVRRTSVIKSAPSTPIATRRTSSSASTSPVVTSKTTISHGTREASYLKPTAASVSRLSAGKTTPIKSTGSTAGSSASSPTVRRSVVTARKTASSVASESSVAALAENEELKKAIEKLKAENEELRQRLVNVQEPQHETDTAASGAEGQEPVADLPAPAVEAAAVVEPVVRESSPSEVSVDLEELRQQHEHEMEELTQTLLAQHVQARDALVKAHQDELASLEEKLGGELNACLVSLKAANEGDDSEKLDELKREHAKQIAALEEKHAAELEALKTAAAMSAIALEQVQAALSESMARTAELEVKIADYAQLSNNVKHDKECTLLEHDALEANLQALKKELEAAQSMNAAEVAEMSARFAREYHVLTESHSAEVQKFTAEATTLRDLVTGLESAKSVLECKINDLNEALAALQSESQASEARLQELQATNFDLVSQLATYQSQVSSSTGGSTISRVEELQITIDGLQAQVGKLTAELAVSTRDHDHQVQVLRAESVAALCTAHNEWCESSWRRDKEWALRVSSLQEELVQVKHELTLVQAERDELRIVVQSGALAAAAAVDVRHEELSHAEIHIKSKEEQVVTVRDVEQELVRDHDKEEVEAVAVAVAVEMRHEEAPQTEASKDLAKAEEIVVVANARELGQAAAHEPAEEVTVVVAASAEDVVEPIKDDGADAVQVLVVEASAITSEQSQAQTEIAVAELCGTEREHAPSGSIAFNSEELAQAQVETVAEPEQVTLTTEESLNVVVVETQAVANEASTVTVEQVQVQTVVNEGECDVLGSHEPNDAITLASAVVAQTQDEQFAEQEQVVVSDSSSISVETHILTTIDKSEPQAAVPEPVAHDESLLEDDVVVERETCMEQASRTATAESLTEEATSQAQEHIRAEEEHVVMSSTSSVSLEHVEAHVDVAQSQEVVVTSSATVSIVEAEVHHTLIEQERPTAIMQDQSIEVADRVAVSQIEVEQSPSVGFITEPAIVVDVVPLSLDGASEEAQVLPPSSVAVAEEATHSSNIQTSGLDVADDQVTIIAASQTVSIDGADAVVQGSSEVISVIREEIQGVSQEVQVVTEEVVLQDQTLELANSSTITTSLSQQAEVCNQAGELITTSQIVQESSTLVANAEHDAVSAAESVLVAELNVQEQTQVLETFNVDAEESSVVLDHVASETVVHPFQEQAADVATSEESAPVQVAEQEVELQHSAQAVAIDVAESAAEVHASMEDMQTTTTSPTQELAHGSSEVVAQQQDAAVTFESQEQAAIVSESHALAQVSVEQSDLVQSVAVAVSEQSDVALEDHDHEMPESLSIESAVSTESQEEVFTVSVVSEHVLIQDSLQVETEQAQVTVSEQIAAYDSQVTDYTTTQVESSIHAEPAVATQVSEFHGHASTEVAVSVGAVDGLVHNTDAVVAAQADDICHSASSHIAIAEAHETEIVSNATAASETCPEADTSIVDEQIVAPEQVVLTKEAPASDDSAPVACSTPAMQAQEHNGPHEQQTDAQVDSIQDLQKVVESEQAIAAMSSQSESSQAQVETNVEAQLEASTIVQVESHVEVAVTELVTESDVGVHDSSLDDGAGVTVSVVGAGIAAAVASRSSNDVEVCDESVSGPCDAAAVLQQETALVQSVEGNIDDLSSLGQEVVQQTVQLDVHAESTSLSMAAEHGSHEASQVTAVTAEIDQQELNEAHSSTPAITTTTSRAEAPAIAVADTSAAQSDNEAGQAVVVQDVHHSQDVEAVTTECIQYEAAEEILVQDDAVQEVSAQEPAEQEVSVQKVAALEIVAQEVTVVTEQVVLAEHESSSSIAGGATTTLGVAVAAVGIATSAVSSGDDEMETELVSEVPASATISTSTLYSEIVVEEATTRLSDVNTAEQLESHSVESISSLVQVERESDATSTVDIVGASHVPATSHDSQEVGDCVQVIEVSTALSTIAQAEETSVHAVQEEEITQPHQTLAIESVHAVTVVAAADLDVAPAIVVSSDSQSSSEADNGHAVLQVEEHALVQADDVDCAHLPQEAAQVEHTIQVATESFEHTVIEHTQVETAIEARKDHLEEGESSSSSDIGFAGTSAISGDVSVADGNATALGDSIDINCENEVHVQVVQVAEVHQETTAVHAIDTSSSSSAATESHQAVADNEPATKALTDQPIEAEIIQDESTATVSASNVEVIGTVISAVSVSAVASGHSSSDEPKHVVEHDVEHVSAVSIQPAVDEPAASVEVTQQFDAQVIVATGELQESSSSGSIIDTGVGHVAASASTIALDASDDSSRESDAEAVCEQTADAAVEVAHAESTITVEVVEQSQHEITQVTNEHFVPAQQAATSESAIGVAVAGAAVVSTVVDSTCESELEVQVEHSTDAASEVTTVESTTAVDVAPQSSTQMTQVTVEQIVEEQGSSISLPIIALPADADAIVEAVSGDTSGDPGTEAAECIQVADAIVSDVAHTDSVTEVDAIETQAVEVTDVQIIHEHELTSSTSALSLVAMGAGAVAIGAGIAIASTGVSNADEPCAQETIITGVQVAANESIGEIEVGGHSSSNITTAMEQAETIQEESLTSSVSTNVAVIQSASGSSLDAESNTQDKIAPSLDDHAEVSVMHGSRLESIVHTVEVAETTEQQLSSSSANELVSDHAQAVAVVDLVDTESRMEYIQSDDAQVEATEDAIVAEHQIAVEVQNIHTEAQSISSDDFVVVTTQVCDNVESVTSSESSFVVTQVVTSASSELHTEPIADAPESDIPSQSSPCAEAAGVAVSLVAAGGIALAMPSGSVAPSNLVLQQTHDEHIATTDSRSEQAIVSVSQEAEQAQVLVSISADAGSASTTASVMTHSTLERPLVDISAEQAEVFLRMTVTTWIQAVTFISEADVTDYLSELHAHGKTTRFEFIWLLHKATGTLYEQDLASIVSEGVSASIVIRVLRIVRTRLVMFRQIVSHVTHAHITAGINNYDQFLRHAIMIRRADGAMELFSLTPLTTAGKFIHWMHVAQWQEYRAFCMTNFGAVVSMLPQDAESASSGQSHLMIEVASIGDETVTTSSPAASTQSDELVSLESVSRLLISLKHTISTLSWSQHWTSLYVRYLLDAEDQTYEEAPVAPAFVKLVALVHMSLGAEFRRDIETIVGTEHYAHATAALTQAVREAAWNWGDIDVSIDEHDPRALALNARLHARFVQLQQLIVSVTTVDVTIVSMYHCLIRDAILILSQDGKWTLYSLIRTTPELLFVHVVHMVHYAQWEAFMLHRFGRVLSLLPEPEITVADAEAPEQAVCEIDSVPVEVADAQIERDAVGAQVEVVRVHEEERPAETLVAESAAEPAQVVESQVADVQVEVVTAESAVAQVDSGAAEPTVTHDEAVAVESDTQVEIAQLPAAVVQIQAAPVESVAKEVLQVQVSAERFEAMDVESAADQVEIHAVEPAVNPAESIAVESAAAQPEEIVEVQLSPERTAVVAVESMDAHVEAVVVEAVVVEPAAAPPETAAIEAAVAQVDGGSATLQAETVEVQEADSQVAAVPAEPVVAEVESIAIESATSHVEAVTMGAAVAQVETAVAVSVVSQVDDAVSETQTQISHHVDSSSEQASSGAHEAVPTSNPVVEGASAITTSSSHTENTTTTTTLTTTPQRRIVPRVMTRRFVIKRTIITNPLTGEQTVKETKEEVFDGAITQGPPKTIESERAIETATTKTTVMTQQVQDPVVVRSTAALTIDLAAVSKDEHIVEPILSPAPRDLSQMPVSPTVPDSANRVVESVAIPAVESKGDVQPEVVTAVEPTSADFVVVEAKAVEGQNTSDLPVEEPTAPIVQVVAPAESSETFVQSDNKPAVAAEEVQKGEPERQLEPIAAESTASVTPSEKDGKTKRKSGFFQRMFGSK